VDVNIHDVFALDIASSANAKSGDTNNKRPRGKNLNIILFIIFTPAVYDAQNMPTSISI
tara:strand:- start:257 stop:433 length:177 start_codon:yes stop_codon:yes gene_type:complete